MANQRKPGIERITLTIPDAMLAQIEADAARQGKDRLTLMREVLAGYLARPQEAPPASPPAPAKAKPKTKPKPASAPPAPPAAKPTPRPTSKKRGVKPE